MKVAVIGSRGLLVDDLGKYLPDDTTEIISGSAKGVDASAREYALLRGTKYPNKLQDVATLVTSVHRNREPLMHCAVYLDLAAKDLEGLRTLRDEVTSELVRSRLAADRILLKQREESEYELIRFPQRGVCLYKCGNERYLLEVIAPEYKKALFGEAGGR